MILKKDFTYIDLFAGIGGFHCAMDNISEGKAKCIYASEIDDNARKIYEENFKIKPLGDIHQVNPSDYPAPDVVCGGFPCQTFSKAGKQNGFKDPRGTLFREIIRIIEYYPFKERPKFLILENVRNLISHDNGNTWKTIRHEIQNVGYNVVDTPLIVAPKDVGVPQLRDRAIILAIRNDLFSKPIEINLRNKNKNVSSIYTIIDHKKLYGSKPLSEEQMYAIDCWQDFISNVKKRIIGFPIWSDEFGDARNIADLPIWKQEIINKNRDLYLQNKEFIDNWLKKWKVRNKLTPTNRKFEWQVGGKIDSIYDGIIQFRTSGIRVKLPTESPALVAMVHLPIIGKERRTISVLEAARLQSFPDTYIFNESPQLAFKQLGNAVNVKVIETAFREFLKYVDCKIGE